MSKKKHSLDHVQVHLVESLDDALAFKEWLGTRHANDVIAVDTETTGLEEYLPTSRVRLIQFGDTEQGWALPWEDWRGVALEALRQWRGDIVMQHCFSGDTSYLTADGPQTLSATVDTTQEVWTRDGWQKAEIRAFGLQPTQRITFAPKGRRTNIRREVVATPDHRWELQSGRLVVGLQPGDHVPMAAPEVPWQQDSEGFRHGLIFGDGAVLSKGRQRARDGHYRFILRLCGKKAQFASVFEHVTQPPSNTPGEPNCYHSSLTHMKQLPPSGDAQYLRAFIEGWSAADGTFNGTKRSRQICTTVKEHADWLVENAAHAGLVCVGSSSHTNPGGYTGQPLTTYLVTVCDPSDHTKRFDAWTVLSVDDAMEQEVYCAVVPGIERFTLGHGIYTSNCKFDVKWIQTHSDFRFNYSKLHDTKVQAHLIDSTRPTGLKPLTDRLIDPRGSIGQKILKQAFVDNGWDWATVPVSFVPYHAYAGLDTVMTAMLHDIQFPQVDRDYRVAYDLEMAVQFVCMEMEQRGARVDLDYSARKHEELGNYAVAVRAWCKKKYGFAMGSNGQLADWFEERGCEFDELTAKTGKPKMDKDQLKAFAIDEDPEIVEVARQTLAMRKAQKLASAYFGNIIDLSHDGIIHPSINTLAARTSRMCLPDSHMLVTRDGVLSVDEVQVGDETVGADGSWVQVHAIHRYRDQPVTTWQHSHRRFKLECTDEHRWVTYSGRGKQELEPLGERSRQSIQLHPDTAAFDFEQQTFGVLSDDERFAALVGMLITDGRCSEPPAGVTGVGMHAMVYQTERKYYKEFLDVIPDEAIIYDRVTNDFDHHEIGISAKWLRPRLEDAGLVTEPGSSLRHATSLAAWVLRLSDGEVRQFFRAVWLSDGRTSCPESPTLSCTTSDHVERAVKLAAYRLGYRTSTGFAAPSGWGTRTRRTLLFTQQMPNTRNMQQIRGEQSDVWCVTTADGTFTAWSEANGPYLTGNSISSPALQQLPKDDATVRGAFIPREDGHVLLSSDLDQVEFRMFAAYSQDPALIAMFKHADSTGSDAFTEIMRQVYRTTALERSDPRRNLVKSMIYGRLYGAGVKKQAETAGVPYEQMKSLAGEFDRTYPGVAQFQAKVEDQGKRREWDDGRAWIALHDGRRLYADEGKGYTLVNYCLQGGAASIFKSNLLRLSAAGLTQYMVVPVHDEIVMSLPKELVDEVRPVLQECMTTTEGWAIPLTAGVDGPYEVSWGEKYA